MERSNVKPYNQKKANQSWLPHWEVKAETRCGWGAHFLVKAKEITHTKQLNGALDSNILDFMCHLVFSNF